MAGLTFWTGPVSYDQTKGAVLPGTSHKVIECSGATKLPYCRDVSTSMLSSDGRRMPALLDKLGVDSADPIVLAAFSAGGRLVRDLVSRPEDRLLVRAVMLADATYSDGKSGSRPEVSPDWVDFGVFCSDRENGRLWVATASPSPNGTRPTAVETIIEIMRQVSERTGQAFTELEGFYGIEPAPTAAYRLGNVLFANYPLEPLHHGGHVDLATQTFSKILAPWLAAGGVLPDESRSEPAPWWRWPLAAAALAAGGAGGYAIGRRLRA